MKRLLILIFLASCTSPDSNVGLSNSNLDFNNKLSFEKFNELLIEYANTSPYPDINE